MKISQNEGFKPVTVTLETRGELAVLLASVGLTSWYDRKEAIARDFGEDLNAQYNNTGREIYKELKKIFIDTKP